MKMENMKKYFNALIIISLVSLIEIFLLHYPRDHANWTRTLKECPNQLPNMSLMELSKLSQALSQLKPPDVIHTQPPGRKQSMDHQVQSSTKPKPPLDKKILASKLKRSIAKIEYDVLNMDVGLTLDAITAVPLEENRLIHKIQRARVHPNDGCVIRIAKYCANRCDHLLQRNHSKEWAPFQCDFSRSCRLETRFVSYLSTEIMKSVDVLLIVDSLHEGLELKRLIGIRPPGQLWVLYGRESPIHDADYAPEGLTGNPYNLTMTYSGDADIYFPYCFIKERHSRLDLMPSIPKKTKLISWMASNCRLLSWRRTELVRELRKHISVDAYGKCGTKGSLSLHEAGQILPKYKFYLAFESSDCRDYITEKIWRTCLLQGIVPIVFGAKREDYERVLPRKSFIHLEDFSNMSAFVDYIHHLDSDEEAYMKHFDWRKESEITCLSARTFLMTAPEANLCYLFKKLIHLYLSPESSWKHRTPDFSSWWKGQCREEYSPKNVLGFPINLSKTKQRIKRVR
nr:uncharacterized protein LOC129278539 [Lytechinus pictus]